MPLVNYSDVRPWAAAIRESVKRRRMPPWFADPAHGEFANDPRLSDDEIQLIDRWARSGAKEGRPLASPPRTPKIAKPRSADIVIEVPAPIRVPAKDPMEYQYVILPIPSNVDRWVTGAYVRPSDRSVVHHAVLYVREPGSQWLHGVPPGVPYAPPVDDPEQRSRTRDTKADILAIYTPGAPVMNCPTGMAKKIPANSDLVLQLHYTAKISETFDQPEVGLYMSAVPPKKRIITLQMDRITSKSRRATQISAPPLPGRCRMTRFS